MGERLMIRRWGAMLVAVALLAGWAYGQPKAQNTAAPKAHSAPAAVKAGPKAPAKSKPLLLLDNDEDSSPAKGADNSRCYVCHANFQKEDLAVTHARAEIGCAKCHGACDAHIDDESWTSGGKGTAPDKMYARNKVIPFCVTCHEVSKRDTPGCQFPQLTEKKACTDCHGKHHLPTPRKCKWK
jgi:hypothetical protein